MVGRGGCLLRRLVGAGLLVLLLSAGGPAWGAAVLPVASAAASADASILEAQLLQLVNAERARSGLPAVGADVSMNAMARSHSQAMAAQDRLFHDPARLGLLGRCLAVAENVGRAATTDIVHQAFMASAIHRSDILGPYDLTGVGVAAGPSMVYVTEVFCRSNAPQPAPQPSPAPAKPSPAPVNPSPAPVKRLPPTPAAVPPALLRAPVRSPAPAPPPFPDPSPSHAAPPAGMGTPCRLL